MAQFNTSIILCRLPFHQLEDNNYPKEVWEGDIAVQNLFTTRMYNEYTILNGSYMRIMGGTVKVKANADVLLNEGINYVMFNNLDFTEYRYYGKITDINYINKNVSEITYVIDPVYTFFPRVVKYNYEYTARRTLSQLDPSDFIMNLPMDSLADLGGDYVVSDFNFSGYVGDSRFVKYYYVLSTKALLNTTNTTYVSTGTRNTLFINNNELQQFQTNNQVSFPLYGYVMNQKCFQELTSRGFFTTDSSVVGSIVKIQMLPYGEEMLNANTSGEKPDNLASYVSSENNPTIGQELPSDCIVYNQGDLKSLYHRSVVSNFNNQSRDYINRVITDQKDRDYKTPEEIGFGVSGFEQYLYRYPYTSLVINDHTNSAFTLMPQAPGLRRYWIAGVSGNLHIRKWASLGVTPTFVYSIGNYGIEGTNEKYNNLINPSSATVDQTYARLNDNMFTVQGSAEIPIVSDSLALFLRTNQAQINAQYTNIRDTFSTTTSNLAQQQYMQNYAAQANYDLSNQVSKTNYDTSITNASAQYDTEIAVAATNNTSISNTLSNIPQGLMDAFTGRTERAVGGPTLGASLNRSRDTWVQAGYLNLTSATNQQVAQLNSIATTGENAKNTANATLANAKAQAETAKNISQLNAGISYDIGIASAKLAQTTAIRSLNAQLQDLSNSPVQIQSMGNNQSWFNELWDRDGLSIEVRNLPWDVMQRVCDSYCIQGVLVNKLERFTDLWDKFKNAHGFYIQSAFCDFTQRIATQYDHIPYLALHLLEAKFKGGLYFWDLDYWRKYYILKRV